MNLYPDYKPSSGAFRARIQVSMIEGHREMEVWSDELTPVDGGRCLVSEWAERHLDDVSNADLIERFEIPPEWECFEIVFDGVITCWPSYYWDYACYEWDEDFEIKNSQIQQLPSDWFGELPSDQQIQVTENQEQGHSDESRPQ